jgi:hypothetical protein
MELSDPIAQFLHRDSLISGTHVQVLHVAQHRAEQRCPEGIR